jgi:hypothetical protein
VAGHVRLELRNVGAKYPFERSRRFPGIQANSGNADRSRLSCEVGDTQLGPNARISAKCVARDAWSSRRIPETAGIVAILGRSRDARSSGSGWNRRRLMASHYAGLPRFFPGARSDRRPDRARRGLYGGVPRRLAKYPFERSHRFQVIERNPAAETIRVRAATVGAAARA